MQICYELQHDEVQLPRTDNLKFPLVLLRFDYNTTSCTRCVSDFNDRLRRTVSKSQLRCISGRITHLIICVSDFNDRFRRTVSKSQLRCISGRITHLIICISDFNDRFRRTVSKSQLRCISGRIIDSAEPCLNRSLDAFRDVSCDLDRVRRRHGSNGGAYHSSYHCSFTIESAIGSRLR